MKHFFLLLTSVLTLSAYAQSFETDTFHTKSGKEVVITFIKHSSLSITYDGLHFQIDPVRNYGTPTDYTAFPKADFILITHEHSDHLDAQAVTDLTKQSTQIILNENSKSKLRKGSTMKNGDKKTLRKDIEIQAVPAYNTTSGREQFHPKGRDNGYILTLDGLRIYIAGDTEDIPELANIKNIDIAFLPINQPYTMTLSQAEKAVRTLKPKVFYPYHFNDTPVSELKDKLKDTSVDVRIRKME